MIFFLKIKKIPTTTHEKMLLYSSLILIIKMSQQKTEPRYRKLMKDFSNTRLSKFWSSYVLFYSKKSWLLSKKFLWGLSVGAIVFLVPLAIETTLEGEARVMQLNSQIQGDINPNVEFRPY